MGTEARTEGSSAGQSLTEELDKMVELMEEVEGEEVEILFQALLQFLYSELNYISTCVQHKLYEEQVRFSVSFIIIQSHSW